MPSPNKRPASSRKTPANKPSPVTEAKDAIKSTQSPEKEVSETRESSENVATDRSGTLSTTGSPTGPERGINDGANAPEQPAVQIPDELIAARAYEIWERRGCPMGHDSEQDWHAAKAELEREQLGWTQAEPADRAKI
jgi:hypothetical protein